MINYFKALFVSLPSILFAQQQIPIPAIEYSPLKYICYQASEPVTVDGVLNEKDWDKAEWTSDFVDIEGSLKPVPRFKTRAKMLWDKDYFYIAAEVHDPHVWASLKNRDDIIFFDNDFEIFIDPDGDTINYLEFEMNALNTVWDLLLTHPYRDVENAALHQFDLKGLKSGVHIYGTINNPNDKDSCWTLEVAFPWSSLKEISIAKLPPVNNTQWRINFSRVEWKTEVINGVYSKIINPETKKSYSEDNWVWSPQGVVNMHYPEMWGYVQFSETIIGNKKEDFLINQDENAKWFLRNIYYNEKNYYAKNKCYTSNLEQLNEKNVDIQGYKYPPLIESTTNLFEVSLESIDGKYEFVINNEGAVFKKEIKKSSVNNLN